MKAIICTTFGDEDVMKVSELPELRPDANEVVIDVNASGVNRADLLQRRGHYPPPKGVSPILGLEVAGTIKSVGSQVLGFAVGEPVMALLSGGGYAAEASVDAGSVMHIPPSINKLYAAGLPEVFLTAYLNLFELGGLVPGEVALVHGGSGGVGTAAIQLAHEAGCHIIVTAGSPERCRRAIELGANLALNYHSDDWQSAALDFTDGKGVDVILDCIGAEYLDHHLRILHIGGRLILIGLMGGFQTEIDLRALLAKRISLIGSTLRSRSNPAKAQLTKSFQARFGRALTQGRIRPVIDRILPFERAPEAHRLLAQGAVFGKILLRP